MGSPRASSLLVLIPALNEEATVGAVVRDARATLRADVVVIDDGSSDATAERAADAGATVLSLPFNLGVGGAIRTGLKYARRMGYDTVVQLDGDGQHSAAEAVRLVETLRDGALDLVVGSRFAHGYSVSRTRRLSMRWLSMLVSRRARTKITDTTSGFRAMSHRAIGVFSEHYPVDYLSDTVEALLIAAQTGLRIQEVSVQMRVRQGGTASTGFLKSVYHLIRLSLVIMLYLLRGKPSRSPGESDVQT